ncbi:hypothetical protein C0416_04970 [bacterium]|nr:hypothetical protein [bacterium]
MKNSENKPETPEKLKKGPSFPKEKERILGGTRDALAAFREKIKESMQAKKSAEEIKEIKEKNYRVFLAELKKLKPGSKGVGFVTTYGGEFSVLRKGKDSYYTVDDKGRQSTFSSKDLLTRALGISQLIPAENVAFVDPMALPSATIEEGSLYASTIEEMLNNSPKENELLEHLELIANLHKKRKLAHTYDVAPNYKITVSDSGVAKLSQGKNVIASFPKKNPNETASK